MEKYRVYFLRICETDWDVNHQFPGWIDTQLTNKGLTTSKQIGLTLINANIKLDQIYISMLQPSKIIAENIYEEYIKKYELKIMKKPIFEDWRLNERHFGNLTSFTKNDMMKKYGHEKVENILHDFDDIPPEIEETHPMYNEIMNNPKWDIDFLRDMIPTSESYKAACLRIQSFWEEIVVPLVRRRKIILVIGHSYSLRGLIKYLGRLPERNIVKYMLPKGVPFYYDLDNEMRPIGKLMPYFLTKINEPAQKTPSVQSY